MTDEERIFISERFGREGNEKNLEVYKSLSDELRASYREACRRNPEWSHTMVLAFIDITNNSEFNIPNNTEIVDEIMKQQMCHDSMRGVGFDIANSSQLNEKQKKELIRACENYFYNDVPFNKYHKSLLYKVRKEYHIVLTGLSEIAKPKGIFDILFGI